MKTRIRIFKILTLFFLIPTVLLGQKRYDIHYVSVGSGFYEPLGKEAHYKLSDINAANLSATMMSNLFDSIGAKNGTSLISTKRKTIRKSEVLNAVKLTIKSVKREKNPFILFYFCGHGFTNGELEAHFMATGEFKYNTDELTYADWIDVSLPPLDIRELLEDSKIPYMMLIDTCDSGEEKKMETFTEYEVEFFGLAKADELMKASYSIIIELNRMTGPNPVVFSAEAGSVASIVSHVFKDGIKRRVGPICKKSHIILQDRLNTPVGLSDFMMMLLDKQIDNSTKDVNSSWVFDVENLNYIKKQ